MSNLSKRSPAAVDLGVKTISPVDAPVPARFPIESVGTGLLRSVFPTGPTFNGSVGRDALPLDARILLECGFPSRLLDMALAKSRVQNVGVADILITDRRLDPEFWARSLAAALGLRFAAVLQVDANAETDGVPPVAFLRLRHLVLSGHPSIVAVAPRADQIDFLSDQIAANPDFAERLVIATPQVIRQALARRHASSLTRYATGAIRDRDATQSAASISLSIPKLIVASGLLILVDLVLSEGLGVPVFGLVLLPIFLAIGVIRLSAALVAAPIPSGRPLEDHDLPRFTVLVPLYREAESLPLLVSSLCRLDYPTDRLDVKLIVEGDDHETRKAASALARQAGFDVVVVPPSSPRTKPKALNFALAMVDADYVTVFDAEDRPDPNQLRRAAEAFANGPANLVCVQAALVIDHPPDARPWLSRQFSLEYAMLFEGLLPWLAARGLFFPIGGTSNHFRCDALRAVGPWDPHNVTEDADLAVRLVRAGGRIGVIASRTREEAPLKLGAWFGQRTRWIKGWYQTWLVHMRRPGQLLAELGFVDFVLFQLLMIGQVISTFIHPTSMIGLVSGLLGLPPLFSPRDLIGQLVLYAFLASWIFGLLGAIALALSIQRAPHIARLAVDIPTMPFYWILQSMAAILALIELVRDPHRWNKTAHGMAHGVNSTTEQERVQRPRHRRTA